MTVPPGTGSPVDPLDVFMSDMARHRTDIDLRGRRRGYEYAARDTARLVGTLRDLAEAREDVVLRSSTGRQHRGVVESVGADHVRMRLSSHRLLLAVFAIRAVQPVSGTRIAVATGDRDDSEAPTMAEALEDLVADRATVGVACDGLKDVLRGTVVGVGDDLITLSAEYAAVYLPLASVAEITWTDEL